MHTYTFGDVTFHYNADLSGEVRIVREDGHVLAVPGEALLVFVAGWVGRQRIREIERMTEYELLGLRDRRVRTVPL